MHIAASVSFISFISPNNHKIKINNWAIAVLFNTVKKPLKNFTAQVRSNKGNTRIFLVNLGICYKSHKCPVGNLFTNVDLQAV